MSNESHETRDTVILGHRLEVYPSGDGRWGVTVDGERITSTLANAYAAWAVGAAESFRRGKVVGTPRMDD